ncbi:hypothetical protein [Bacillus wiedmannii]|uniref:Uncharacterized protein n=1 Tax=Bacillus wiedmannii TaxID=1890302 RepID=A0A2B6S6W3_9BACI|nr:hypothetical protein [Bacillus wiedmannii]MDF9661485.1 hypothetical protein [Bacillus wiedmannii]PGD36662.1 hypothetical protein COM27_11670 [Bacillus wiedmannii]
MKEKVYSLATPSLFIKEKNYTVSITSESNFEKSYCVALSVTNPFGKNEHEFPVSMPASSRVKAVTEDDAGIFATKRTTKIKGVFSDIVEQASRQVREIEASTTSLDSSISKRLIEFDMEVSDIQDAQQSRCFSIDVSFDEEALQHERIFKMDHIVDEHVNRPVNTHEILIANEEVLHRTTNEHEMNPVIKEEVLHKKVREFAVDVDELPEWVNVARVLYGENFYESIVAARQEKEIKAATISVDTSNITINELEAINISDAELADRSIREMIGSYEEYEIFNGQGIPVYLPDYDLFARIQRELSANYVELSTGDRDALHINGEDISFELVDRSISEIGSSLVDSETLLRKKIEMDLIEIDFNQSNRVTNEIKAREAFHEYAERKNKYHETEKMNESEANRVTNEFIANDVAHMELTTPKGREYGVNMADISDSLNVNREFNTGNIIEIDNGDRNIKDVYSVINNTVAADKVITTVSTDYIETDPVNKITKDIVTVITENELSNRFDTETIVLEEIFSLAGRNILQIDATREEMDLFEGLGIPVYLPDFDMFSRIKREFITETTLSEIISRPEINISSRIVDTVDMVRPIKEIMTDVSGATEFERPLLELDSQIDYDYDAADTPVKKASIHEQDLFDASRQFEADEITGDTFARESTIETVVSESEQFNRQIIFESSIIENDSFKVNMLIDATCIKFEHFIVDNIYNAEIIEGDEKKEVVKEDPKLWLRHSRQSWWTNSNWKKTR